MGKIKNFYKKLLISISYVQSVIIVLQKILSGMDLELDMANTKIR
jgi:hypothetical protein